MAIFVVVILLWNTFQAGKGTSKEIGLSTFMEQVEKGRVSEVTIRDGDKVSGKLREGGQFPPGTEFTLDLPDKADFAWVETLRKNKVDVKAVNSRDNPLF